MKESRQRARESILAQVASTLEKHLEEADRELEDQICGQLADDIAATSRAGGELAQAVAAMAVDCVVSSENSVATLAKKVEIDWTKGTIANSAASASAPIREASQKAKRVAEQLVRVAAQSSLLENNFELQQKNAIAEGCDRHRLYHHQ